MEGSSATAPSHNSDYNYSAPIFNANLRKIIEALGILIVIIIVVFSAFVAMSSIAGLIHYWPDFSVDSLSLTNFTITNGSRLFMEAEVRLTVWNPNTRYSLSYENTVASMYYKYELLSQTRGLPRFSHEAGNETSLLIEFAAGDYHVDEWVVDGINGENERRGSVGFNFWFISRIVWGDQSLEDDTYRVLCRDLVVRIPTDGSSGRLVGEPKHCVIQTESYFSAFH